MEKREQFLQEVLQSLDSHSKAALALIYMRNDKLESPIDLQESEEQALKRLGSDLGGCITALEALNGSLGQYTKSDGDSIWRFKHPTIGDAYAAILALNPELLGIYVQGSATEKLIKQVTCGNVGIQNAVIIPKALFSLMLRRLSEISTTAAYKESWRAKWRAREDLLGFLTRRCSKEFLTLYLELDPGLLKEVSNPGLFLNSVPEVDLAVRLHEFGLLPEDRRNQFIATVSEYALEGQDLYALQDPGIRGMFEAHEFEELLVRVRTELLPRLDDVRWDWESNHDSDLSPDEYMQPLLDSFETLKRIFADDESAVAIIDRESEYANFWIVEHMPEDTDTKPSRELGGLQPPDALYTERSIFDDVDT